MSKVVMADSGCWMFTGATNKNGYGIVGLGLAHRVSYMVHVGKIPDGLGLDHTCHTKDNCAGGPTCAHRRCINPLHLQPCDNLTNTRRGHTGARQLKLIHEARRAATHCKRGHPFDATNTYWRNGIRACRICKHPKRDKKWSTTHCRHGHEYTPETTYMPPSGRWRQCVTCSKNTDARRRLRKRLKRVAGPLLHDPALLLVGA
jgi:hypothetical protein